jgi:hypothetical protein
LWGRIKGKLDDLKYKIKEKFDDKFGWFRFRVLTIFNNTFLLKILIVRLKYNVVLARTCIRRDRAGW